MKNEGSVIVAYRSAASMCGHVLGGEVPEGVRRIVVAALARAALAADKAVSELEARSIVASVIRDELNGGHVKGVRAGATKGGAA